mmetsp:Transcript_34439/g.87083  ORF Transcript_34439/g.87083 Transcript_34439/m.87083 type:complete len:227 (-) Transcript_34439:56-736(-)
MLARLFQHELLGMVGLLFKRERCRETGERYDYDVGQALNATPAAVYRDVKRHIKAKHADRSLGVWVGRRALYFGGDSPADWGVGLAPGIDVYHMAISINGKVYNMCTMEDDHGTKRVGEPETDYNIDSDQGRTFMWFFVDGVEVIRSGEELLHKAQSFTGRPYEAILPSGQQMNCQTWVISMLAYATGLTETQARSSIGHSTGGLFEGAQDLRSAEPIELLLEGWR